MKVPAGIFISNTETAKSKYLLTPIDMGHYLKIKAGSALDSNLNENVTVLEKLKQVFNQLLKMVEKNNDPDIFKKATENLPKIVTKNFTRDLTFKEKEVIMLEVSQTSDLMPPDGELLLKLISAYPEYYKTSKNKKPLSEIIKIVESGSNLYILNDIYLPQENRMVIGYGELLTKELLSSMKSELTGVINKKKEDIFTDVLSSGEKVARNDIYSYMGILLKKSDESMDENFIQSPQFQQLLKGDPEIYYIDEKEFNGTMIYDKNNNSLLLLRKIFKTNYLHLIDYFSEKNGLFSSIIKGKNPKIIITVADTMEEIEELINNLKETFTLQTSKYNKKSEVIFIVNKQPEIEKKIRENGFTFILDKKIIFSNFNQFSETLNNLIKMFND